MSLPNAFGFSEFTTWPWPFRRDLERYKAAGAILIEVCEFKLPHGDYGESLDKIEEAGLKMSVQAVVHSIFEDSMSSKPAIRTIASPRSRTRLR